MRGILTAATTSFQFLASEAKRPPIKDRRALLVNQSTANCHLSLALHLMGCENGRRSGTLDGEAPMRKKNMVSDMALGTRGSSYFKARSERGSAYDGVSGANKRMKRDLARLPETVPNHPEISHLVMGSRL